MNREKEIEKLRLTPEERDTVFKKCHVKPHDEFLIPYLDAQIRKVLDAGYRPRPKLTHTEDGQQIIQVGITRKEFLKLPMVARRRILKEQAQLAHDREGG